MSNIALSWAYRCHVGNAPAKAILVYLADRASDDGTAAFPKIETIEQVTEFSHSTVRRSLKLLQERGFIRKGDQRYARIGKNGRDRLPQYCQIVWDLAVDSDPATLAWVERTHTSEYDPATMSRDADPESVLVPDNDETRGLIIENPGTKPIPSSVTVTPLENTVPETRPIEPPAVSQWHPQQAHTDTASSVTVTPLHIKEETIQVNPPSQPIPSAPTGHLPASGATAAESEINTSRPDERELAESAEGILASLAEQRSKLGLTTPVPTNADRRAVTGLIRRLAEHGERQPAKTASDAIAFALKGEWWPKRIRTGRNLAKHWDELADDMTIAANHADQAKTGEAEAKQPEPFQPWLPEWAVETLAAINANDTVARTGGES